MGKLRHRIHKNLVLGPTTPEMFRTGVLALGFRVMASVWTDKNVACAMAFTHLSPAAREAVASFCSDKHQGEKRMYVLQLIPLRLYPIMKGRQDRDWSQA